MAEIYLNIKQKYFDEIIAGTKKQEFREVKPTTIKKLLQLNDKGFEIQDEKGNSLPIQYDTIHFRVGMARVADEAWVKVNGIHTEILVDENNHPYEYVTDKNGTRLFEDAEGKVIKESDLRAIDESFKTDGEAEAYFNGVHLLAPVFDENNECTNGLYWVVQQVVFDLGEVIKKNIVTKKKK